MPIYHKTTPPSTVGNHNTAEIDYHNSEAAKVKRTREQAYFNSYNFDAIEVLPYKEDVEEEEEEEKQKEQDRGGENRNKQKLKEKNQQKEIEQQHIQKQQQKRKNSKEKNYFKAAKSLNCNSLMDNHHLQHHHHHHHEKLHQQQQHEHHHHHYEHLQQVNGKYKPSLYRQYISSMLAAKANNSTKPQLQQQHKLQHQQQPPHYHNNHFNKTLDSSGGTLSHDKLSSTEASSTSLSSSSIVLEMLTDDNVNDDDDDDDDIADVIATEFAQDVSGTTGTRTSSFTTANMNMKTAGMITCSSSAIITSAVGLATSTTNFAACNGVGGGVAGNESVGVGVGIGTGGGSNFLLPRAMLKYQSSTTSTQLQGDTSTTAGITNSMPLATNDSSSSRNTNSPTNLSRRQQEQHQKIILHTARDAQKLDGLRGKKAMMPISGSNTSLRLKKTSCSSSVITSLASEDIEEDRDLERNVVKLNTKADKVLVTPLNNKASVRASSHQSHYSTDKSASSGYYSSNVCSTYSLEEHIYSEPTLDIKKLRNNAKENKSPSTTTTAATAVAPTASTASTLQTNNKLLQHQQLNSSETANSVMRSLDMNRRYRFMDNNSQAPSSNRNSQEFSENLKILESSIENLDRHLKSFPGVNPQETLVNYAQIPYNAYASVNHNDKLRSSSSYQQLPTIQESIDAIKKQTWPPEDPSDDSLMDIDLDSFLLDKDQKSSHKTKEALAKKGLVNPSFLTDEQEENHYKCAKYINSCPEDAYRVESDILAPARSSISGQSVAVSVDLYPKRYEEQLHFQNTRELLEDVRDKIRLLTENQEVEQHQSKTEENRKEELIPKELQTMINTLKRELELYLDRMNQHSELEIRQLCTGLVKNQHIVKMKNAFERRRSLNEVPDIYSAYEAVQDGVVMNAQGMPISITQQITSIRCSSDPNFKMKRKSITEVFPMAECYVESVPVATHNNLPFTKTTQLQRNLSYHKPVLEQQLNSAKLAATAKAHNICNATGTGDGNTTGATSGSGGGDTSEPNDKESILDWHRKKPSIWEMYYGTNRIQQSLLSGKKNGLMMVTTASTSSPSTMCYPSSRPESDFTLDLPRAEQLRIKMEKEKKFRQRCRLITTFLSLVFFLLTVMVVSLVLTRGKRMFGSMI